MDKLLDTAILSGDELRKHAEPFSEADFIRFFNSLSETELKVRDATQPRYVLEIGLVKLIEMRRVTPIEKLLERLAKLENALANGNFQSESETPSSENEPTLEKKTPINNKPPEDAPFPVSSDSVVIETSETVENSVENKDEFVSLSEQEFDFRHLR